MKLFRTLVLNSVFTLNILLLFLVAFRSSIEVPAWLQVMGRMHPLILHFPIGWMILCVLLLLFRSGFKRKAFDNFLNFVLYFLALSAVVAAIMGLLLSEEGGYNEETLNLHLTTGVSVSILSAVLLGIRVYVDDNRRIFNFTMVISAVILVFAGHFGTILTHGDNFIWQPLASETEELVITDSTSLYRAAIHPILRAKCFSCHNERKAKGKLIMTSEDRIVRGGEDGPIWVAGSPEKSTIIKRIHLPEEHDDHMPPSGKPQLSEKEKKLLYHWILQGADLTRAWTEYNVSDSVRIIASEFIQAHHTPTIVHYTFPFAKAEVIQNLNTPYCTVTQIALDEPAIAVDFFLSQAYDAHKLEELLSVKEQVVSLNLAKMPVVDGQETIIQKFVNLEKLNLNQTGVTGKFVSSLNTLKKLKSLSLVGTNVDKASLQALASSSSLKEIFTWNTKVNTAELAELQKEFPSVSWDRGYPSSDILKLTSPILVNQTMLLESDEGVTLKSSMPGTQIRYSLDGTDPDSVKSQLYSGPISIPGYAHLTSRAFKDGWYGSPAVQFYFFKKGVKASNAELQIPPDKDYKGEAAVTLIDQKKGTADNFKEITWLAFHDKPLEATFQIESAVPISKVTLSYCENPGPFILPPASVELWAGADRKQMKLVSRIIPVQPTQYQGAFVKGIEFAVPPARKQYYKIIAKPVPVVPAWISKKKEKGWLFVDEVLFN